MIERLTSEPLTVEMRDNGGSAKVGDLPWEILTGAQQSKALLGDIVLLEDPQIAICYGEIAGAAACAAKIGDSAKERLLAALGTGDVTVTFSPEWGE